MAGSFAGGFAHDDCGESGGAVSVRWRAVVQHGFWARWNDHGNGVLVAGAVDREERVEISGGESGDGSNSGGRGGTGEDSARDAARRNGHAERSAVRAVLRRGGYNTAVRHAGGAVLGENAGLRIFADHLAE